MKTVSACILPRQPFQGVYVAFLSSPNLIQVVKCLNIFHKANWLGTKVKTFVWLDEDQKLAWRLDGGNWCINNPLLRMVRVRWPSFPTYKQKEAFQRWWKNFTHLLLSHSTSQQRAANLYVQSTVSVWPELQSKLVPFANYERKPTNYYCKIYFQLEGCISFKSHNIV